MKIGSRLSSCIYKKANKLISGSLWNVLPVFGSNSEKYDLKLIKSYLLPILVIQRGFEPTVLKKPVHLIHFC